MSRASTGHIRKLPSGRWQARFTFPDGVRRAAPVTFQTKKDAHAWLAQQSADVSRGVWSPTKAATAPIIFADYSKRWLANRRVEGQPLADRTREGYQDLLDRLILPTFGNKLVHTISRDDIDGWYEKVAKGRPTYKARGFALLRTILGSAVDDGFYSVNPAKIRGAGYAPRRHQVEPATLEELAALTEAMSPRYRLLVQLAAWCALRFGELTELRRSDIDTKRGVIRVRRAVVHVKGGSVVKRPKSEAGARDVNIPPHLLPSVREHLLMYTAPGSDGLLFPSRNDPTQHLRQSAMSWIYYPARAAAGRPDLHFHDLRHTGLTWFAQAGATLAELMSRAGHSTPTTALRYQHAAAGRDAALAKKLSAMVDLAATSMTP